MYTYDKLFAEYSHTVAQLLVTWEDFDHPHRLNNLQNTLERLIQLGAVPVINENDPISTEEYSWAITTAWVPDCQIHPRRPAGAAERH